MSGICAVWRKQDPARLTSTITSVCAGLSLDASERRQTAEDGQVALGVSARFSNQQIYQTPELLVVCDAELYDQAESLDIPTGADRGHTRSAADIASRYQRSGAAFLKKLRGEFSVIIWDRRQQLLYAATDGFGTHSLVYYENSEVLLIASRIDALLASGEVPKSIDPRAIANYLNYTVNIAPNTIFLNVKRLLPGVCLVASGSQTRTERYWDMPYESAARPDEETLARKLESLVQESVEAHCRNNDFSSVGAYLSGGTDSSTVVGMMSRLQRGPVKTFSIGFDDQRFNELEYAHIAAKKFQANHHEYLVTAEDCVECLPRMIRSFDEPFGNSSAIPTYFCARLAAQHGVHFLLAGDGGDELFGGNERYRIDKIFEAYQKFPRLLRKGVIEPLLAGMPDRNGLAGKARRYIRRSNFPQPYRFFSYNPLLENSPAEIFDPGFMESLAGYSVLEVPSKYYWEGPAKEHLNRLLYVDVKMTLGDNDLIKVTKMSEMAGVQSRFPFLDRAVAEFSGAIPTHLKVKGLEKRYLFKRAFGQLLPVEILKKTKHGFGIPVAHWMKSDKRLRELTFDTLRSDRTYKRGLFRRDYMDDLFRKHEEDETAFYGDEIWTFLTLELWFRQFVDEPLKVAAL